MKRGSRVNTGDILLADLAPARGREQGGRRPVVVVSHQRYSVIPGLFLAVPLTSTDRGLRHHVAVPADEATGLARGSYSMTEQIPALGHDRRERPLGRVDPAGLEPLRRHLHLFIGCTPS